MTQGSLRVNFDCFWFNTYSIFVKKCLVLIKFKKFEYMNFSLQLMVKDCKSNNMYKQKLVYTTQFTLFNKLINKEI